MGEVRDWPHQPQAVEDVLAAVDRGVKRILVTCPTGGGKTRIAELLIRVFLARRVGVAFYTHRKMLVDQASADFEAAELDHGIRAAQAQGDAVDLDRRLQICSLMTEGRRVIKQGRVGVHDAGLALFDEAHLNKGKVALELMKRHREAGAIILGLTATPVDLEGVYDELIIAGRNSDLRKCGAIVPVVHYGPDEPDWRHWKKTKGWEGHDESLSQAMASKMVMTAGIFGRVYPAYQQINPDGRPTLLFAPGVDESVWFAGQFTKKGVRTAHIDGDDVWVAGEWYKSDSTVRDQIHDDCRSGRIMVVTTRYVLREGVNWPFLSHLILATIFGGCGAYIQAGGRVMRADPGSGKTHATSQDHGGNWWRHGSLNDDVDWTLGVTSGMMTGLRMERLRKPGSKQPFVCPFCGRIWVQVGSQNRCSPAKGGCGHTLDLHRMPRPVVSSDGRLRMLDGPIVRPRPICKALDGPKKWAVEYFKALRGKGVKTFAQAAARFAAENNWQWPNPEWPFMPKDPNDFFRLVPAVDRDELH